MCGETDSILADTLEVDDCVGLGLETTPRSLRRLHASHPMSWLSRPPRGQQLSLLGASLI